jgi:hypothetical protein
MESLFKGTGLTSWQEGEGVNSPEKTEAKQK